MTKRGALVAVLLLAGCTSSFLHSGDSRVVTFELTGSALSADLTYSVGNSGTEQRSGANVPWTKEFSAHSGDFLYLSAQNNGSGSLHCVIASGGHVVAEHTSRGQFSIVQCDGDA